MSIQIEKRAIIKLLDCLTKSDYLNPDIPTNDKTPSWDGFVELYKNKNKKKKKADFDVRIPVQVKGKSSSDITSEFVNHPVEKLDLENYFKDGGIIYFVVLMQDYDNFQIYYDNLTTVKIRRYLNSMGDKKSISIPFRIFPKENIEEFTDIFFNFSLDMHKKPSEKYLSLNDLYKKPPVGFDTISVHYRGIQYKDPKDYFLTHDVVLYANHSDTATSFPVEYIRFTEFGETYNSPVVIDNVEYYPCFRLSQSKEGMKVILGKSISFLHLKNSGNVIFNLKFKGTLSERIKDTEFILALFKFKYYSVTGNKPHTFSFGDGIEDFNFTKNIAYHEKSLNHLKELEKVFEILKIKEDLNMDNMSDKDDEYLNLLVSSILYKESVDLVISNKTATGLVHVRIKICNLSISLLITEEEDGKYRVENFYSGIYSGFYDVPGTDRTINIPIYLALTENDFLAVSNIDYEAIYKSFSILEANSDLINMTYFFIMSMLSAYDKSKNQLLLETSLKILEWINDSGQNAIYEIYLLNKLQILKRNRAFSDPEISQLNEIITTSNDNRILTGAYILLEDFNMAAFHFNKMTQNEQDEFKNYPINIFWKK